MECLRFEVMFVKQETDDEAIEVDSEIDHWSVERALGGDEGGGKCRKLGIRHPPFYTWWLKYGSMAVSDARKLMGSGEGNAKSKKLLPESMPDVLTLPEILAIDFQRLGRGSCRDLGRPVWSGTLRPSRVCYGTISELLRLSREERLGV